MTVIELLKEQFGEMLQDEDCYGLDPAEIYNVILMNDTKRAKEILDQLDIEYDDLKV